MHISVNELIDSLWCMHNAPFIIQLLVYNLKESLDILLAILSSLFAFQSISVSS